MLLKLKRSFWEKETSALTYKWMDRVGAVMPRHSDWQLEAAGIGGVWGRDGRVHGCGA